MRRKQLKKSAGKAKGRVTLTATAQKEGIYESPYPELVFSYRQGKGIAYKGKASIVDALEDYFADLLAEGNPPNVVCDLAGVGRSVYSSWIKRGLAYEERLEDGSLDMDSEYAQVEESFYRFMVTCRRAQAIYLRSRHSHLTSRSNSEWRRDFSILERRDRDTWGKEFAEDRNKNADQYSPDDSFL